MFAEPNLNTGARACRLLTVRAIVFFLAVSCSLSAAAQVEISVPDVHYLAHDKINVGIKNAGSSPITYCVEVGYISYIDSQHSEPSPTPIYIQQKSSRGWGTLLTGPDVGSHLDAEILLPGESQLFPFRVNAHGRIRLVLEYQLGSNERFCQNRRGVKIARSREFSME